MGIIKLHQHPDRSFKQSLRSGVWKPSSKVLIPSMHTGDVEEERICIRKGGIRNKGQFSSSVNIWRNFLYLQMFWVTVLVFVVGFQVKRSIFCHRFWNEQCMECWLLSWGNNAQLRGSVWKDWGTRKPMILWDHNHWIITTITPQWYLEITTIKEFLLGVGQSVSQVTGFPLHVKFGFVAIFLRF